MASFQEDWNERQQVIDSILESNQPETRGFSYSKFEPRIYAYGTSGRSLQGGGHRRSSTVREDRSASS